MNVSIPSLIVNTTFSRIKPAIASLGVSAHSHSSLDQLTKKSMQERVFSNKPKMYQDLLQRFVSFHDLGLLLFPVTSVTIINQF